MRKYLILFLFFTTINSIAQDYEYKLFYESKEVSIGSVFSIDQDTNGYLWLGTSYGLCRFDGQNFKAFYKEDGLLDNYIDKVVVDENSLLWLETRKGIQTFDGFTFSDEIDVLDTKFSLALLKQLNTKTIELESIPTVFNISDTITYEGELFVATEGDAIWVLSEGIWKNLQTEYYFGHNVYDLFLDEQRNFWIASNYGLTNLSKSAFQKHPLVQNRGVLEMIEYDGALWVASVTGVNRVKGEKNTLFSLKENAQYIICLGVNYEGRLQAGGIEGDLYEWNGLDFVVNDAINTSLSGDAVFNIETHKSSTYYACRNKILKADSSGVKEFTLGVNYGRCYDILSDGSSIYFACTEGLFKLTANDIIQYTISDGMIDHYCRVLEMDDNGNLWIGTYSEGVLKFDGQNFTSFSSRNGLSNDMIKSLEWDSTRNSLWVGTNLGLNQLKMDSKGELVTCKPFYEVTGYPFYLCHNNSLLVTDDGRLFFSVNTNDENFEDHLYYLDRVDVVLQSPPPNVFLESFKIWDKENPLDTKIQNASLWDQNISFIHNQNDLSFAISGVHLEQGAFITYQWYLEGYENSWRQETTEKNAHYTNLPSGTYSLNLRAKVAGSNWSSAKQYPFSIIPPFWNRWWFVISIVLLLLALVYTIITIRQKHIHKKQIDEINQLKQKAELELKALRAQLNPHFIFNVLNSIQYSIYDKSSNLGLGFIQDFAVLMRKTLLHSRKKLIPFRDEIAFLKLYIKLENARFETPFSFHLDLKEDEDYYNIYIPPLLLQPYVENAIKHGLFNKSDHSSNSLAIEFRIDSNLLICCIQDNGVGRAIANAKKNKHHVSQGLLMMQERLDYLNVVYKGRSFEHEFTDVFDERGELSGTQVIVRIPLYLKK